MQTRNVARLDYAELHKTGKRVYKQDLIMDDPEVAELKCRGDIDHTLSMFKVDELGTEEDAKEGLEEMDRLSRQFRHIHVDLQNKLAENYKEKYKDVTEYSKKIVDFIKNVRKKIGTLKNQKIVDDALVQVDTLTGKIDKFRQFRDVNDAKLFTHVSQIDDFLSKCESFIQDYYTIVGMVKNILAKEAFEKEINEQFQRYLKMIDDDVKVIKLLKVKILEEQVGTPLVKPEVVAVPNVKPVTSVKAKNLSEEITLRSETLEEKLDLDLDSLTDYQILDISQNKSLDNEFNGILERVTELASLVSDGADEKLLGAASKKRDTVAKKRKIFAESLRKILLERDITPEKLKDAASFKVDLPKFTGYDCSMDFYTFKSKFRQFIEPITQKKHWADFLKRNYLGGMAYTLVEHETDYSLIWLRLKESFGNTRLLLQNKLRDLDNNGGLVKMKGEKITSSLAHLVNTMKELSILANKHGIEGQLYEGGSVEKVLSLIGDNLHRRFRSQNLKSFTPVSSPASVTSESSSFSSSKKDEWALLLEFLKTELSLREVLAVDRKACQALGIVAKPGDNKNDPGGRVGGSNSGSGFTAQNLSDLLCHICDNRGHTLITTAKGKTIIPYYVCQEFVTMTHLQRKQRLESKNLCIGCLYPGAVKGPPHKCFFVRFCCTHPSHGNAKIHVLICDTHKEDDKNKKILAKFKEKFIQGCPVKLPEFTKLLTTVCSISLTVKVSDFFKNFDIEPPVVHGSIFAQQTIWVNGFTLNIFYDNGCGDMVIKDSAIVKLRSVGRALNVRPGPQFISGVGGQETVSSQGVFSICIPLRNGKDALLTGLSLPKITSDLPTFNLQNVGKDIKAAYSSTGGDVLSLPDLPDFVGGETDILLGSKFLKYFPKEIFQLESGLTLYESRFSSHDRSRGVVCGPHPDFTKLDQAASQTAYFTDPVNKLRSGWKLLDEVPLLGTKESFDMAMIEQQGVCAGIDETPHVCESETVEMVDSHDGVDNAHVLSVGASSLPDMNEIFNGLGNYDDDCLDDEENEVCLDGSVDGYCCVHSVSSCVYAARRTPKCVRQFDEIERAGTEITYRCVDCRNCVKCKTSERVEAISIQDEIEDGIIDRSVEVDPVEGVVTAKLPFIVDDPDSRLAPNVSDALKVYKGQVRKLNAQPEDMLSVIESEAKLQELGFVDYLSNLGSEEQEMIMSADVRYFIPWRAVWNENSVSTSCRMVFDASMGCKGGCSLNSLLAKGSNSMNNLNDMHIRWRTHPHAFHTDVTKMYNAVRLHKAHWRYQLYLWHDKLDPNAEPVWKVIKTLIYGVRSSGNQAEVALRRAAELSRDEYPEVCDVINNDMYVDDCLSGTISSDETNRITDEMQHVLAKAGFTLKGFAMTGASPPSNMSSDGETVLVGGMKWDTNGDFIQLNIKELNFSKKLRGKKVKEGIGIIPEVLTLTDCASKVAEIFDPNGLVAPITGGMKVDISLLHQKKLIWDDPIPPELKNDWARHFDVIQELGTLKFQRSIVPNDAENLNVETINSADAGDNLICASVHVRYKLRSGGFSCQLIFARTKVHHETTTPRAEMEAAVLNASTSHVVKTSLKKWYQKCTNVTDSQVVLHWIHCVRSVLKMKVRNRVIETKRLTNLKDWRYVKSEDNVSDIGTRKGATISDVGPDSEWAKGKPWMSEAEENFPLKTVDEVILSNQERAQANKEKISPVSDSFSCLTSRYVPKDVGERYKFSKYVIDPCKFRFTTVLRILAIVFLFLKKIMDRLNTKFGRSKSFNFLKVHDFSSQKGIYEVFPRNEGSSKVAVLRLPGELINASSAYFFKKATCEIQRFVKRNLYKDKSVLKDDILYYTGRILSAQEIDGPPSLGDVCFDLSACTFCVPMTDSHSPIAYAIVNETHWYHPDVSHKGVESVLRNAQYVAHIIGGRDLVKAMRKGCAKCRALHEKNVKAAMGLVGAYNLRVAPPFYFTQCDLCGPVSAYSPANKRATLKIWFTVFCCTVTGAVDIQVMENYTADAFVMAFVRFSCRFGYPKLLMPDEGSQLVNGCENMIISFSDIHHQVEVQHGVTFETCPVNAHYVHGKVERKIQEIRKSLKKTVDKNRLSILQWETLGYQISNSINNMPIGLGNKSEMLENLDILTPNRLILGRNNHRSPSAPLELSNDFRRIIQSNNDIFTTWFKEWMTSYVPTLVERPKWFDSDRNVSVGDVVLFLKSDKEFERIYQYGIVTTVVTGRDGVVRVVDVEYQNHHEKVKRQTRRGVRDLIVIHPIGELGILRELNDLAKSWSGQS